MISKIIDNIKSDSKDRVYELNPITYMKLLEELYTYIDIPFCNQVEVLGSIIIPKEDVKINTYRTKELLWVNLWVYIGPKAIKFL